MTAQCLDSSLIHPDLFALRLLVAAKASALALKTVAPAAEYQRSVFCGRSVDVTSESTNLVL